MTEICLTLFLGLDFSEAEEAAAVVNHTISHWHGESGAELVGHGESGAGLVRVVLVWWGMVRVVLVWWGMVRVVLVWQW